jgi:hypothetical protein
MTGNAAWAPDVEGGTARKETQWPTAPHLTDFVASCTVCAQRTRATLRSGSGVWRRRRRTVRSALGERSPTRARHQVATCPTAASRMHLDTRVVGWRTRWRAAAIACYEQSSDSGGGVSQCAICASDGGMLPDACCSSRAGARSRPVRTPRLSKEQRASRLSSSSGRCSVSSVPAARPRSARVSQTAGFVEEQESDPRSGSPSARLAAHGHGGPARGRIGLGELAEAVSCVRWCVWRAIWASRGRRLQSLAMARRGRESARRRRPVRRAVPPLGAGESLVLGAVGAHHVQVGAAGAVGAVDDPGSVG